MGIWLNRRKENRKVYWDIELTRGDSAYVVVKFEDLEKQEIHLREGDIVRVQVRTASGGVPLIDSCAYTFDFGAVWHITACESKKLDAGDYVWDMQLELPDSGDVFTFVPESSFVVLAEVTRRSKGRCDCDNGQ